MASALLLLIGMPQTSHCKGVINMSRILLKFLWRLYGMINGSQCGMCCRIQLSGLFPNFGASSTANFLRSTLWISKMGTKEECQPLFRPAEPVMWTRWGPGDEAPAGDQWWSKSLLPFHLSLYTLSPTPSLADYWVQMSPIRPGAFSPNPTPCSAQLNEC